MKSVLCYGDSLTWGADVTKLGRHAYEDRWPSVLAAGLGAGVNVIAEGLGGRTTAYDDHLADADRNGARILPTLLNTHKPLDLVIIMLGTNDLKPVVAGTAVAATNGMRRLVHIIRGLNGAWSGEEIPDILLVSPPYICETANVSYASSFAGRIEESKMLGQLYADLADEEGCGFFDASSVAQASPLDGVHLDAQNTRAIGKGLEPMVRMMLGL